MNELIRKVPSKCPKLLALILQVLIARMLHEALSQAELQELQALVDAVKNDKYFPFNEIKKDKCWINSGR